MTLYARREPTTDPLCLKYCPPAQLGALRDVAIYKDPGATKPVARFAPHMTRPDRRNRFVNLNCHRWQLVWMPDA
jgi:hypothetical protein